MAQTTEEQLNGLLSELATALTTDGGACALSPIPKRVIQLYPGAMVAWDNCCDGQLSFQLRSLTPKYRDANGRISMRSLCAVDWWIAVIEVQIVRCTPSVSSAGAPPTPAAIQSSGTQIIDDMQALLAAFTANTMVYEVGPWTPKGPEGGCVGGSWTFSARLDAAPCTG